MRYAVRQVAKKWMVWDKLSRAVAIVDDKPAIGLSEESAKLYIEMLNSQDGAADHDKPGPGKS